MNTDLETAKDIEKAKYFYHLAIRQRPIPAIDALAHLFASEFPDNKGAQWEAMIGYRIDHFKDQYTPN